MQIKMEPGTYVVAVSGGVDSMVLLDLLRQQTDLKLIVAHFDHGIREDSAKDRKLVQKVARIHKVPFVHMNGELGPGTSAAGSRQARYTFLHEVKRASKAKAIITAHHQDDVLETAILNLMRGTGRRGLTSLKSSDMLVRPLLGYSKEQIREYADNHLVAWREDSSNNTNRYTRNYIRHEILPHFSPGHRAQLLILLEGLRHINNELDTHIINLLHVQPAVNKIERSWFIQLPHDVAREVTHAWLSKHGVRDLTRKTIERLIVAMKTGHPGQHSDVDHVHVLHITPKSLALVTRDR